MHKTDSILRCCSKRRESGLSLVHIKYSTNMATRHMLGAFKGSPTRALELEAAIPPPEIRFEKFVTCMHYGRCGSNQIIL